MASRNPFDLLGDFDNDDPSVAIAALQEKKAPSKADAPPPAKLPTKPLPPAQAVRQARSSAGPTRGAARGRGTRGRGPALGRGFANESSNGFAGEYGGYGGLGGGAAEDGDGGRPVERERGTYSGPRGAYYGGRRGGFANGEVSNRPRRVYERRSGTGRGTEIKRDGSGRGNWGTTSDDRIAQGAVEALIGEENAGVPAKVPEQEGTVTEANEDAAKEMAEKEEDKEMTLEEYEKNMEEKRKALLAMKAEERKVELDKEFESMKLLSVKKGTDVFIKLGSDKASRKQRDGADKDERVKKHVSINEFLKPADGERYYRPGVRGRGRSRGDQGNGHIGYDVGIIPEVSIKIEDAKQFPSLGEK